MPTKKNKNITRIVNRVNKSSADFVNRLKDPNRISIPDWEDSRYTATHKLGVGTDNNGQVFIYPSVQNINGKLIDFTNPKFGKWDGMDSAIERGDTVHVDNIQDGLDFTENYKRYYPTGKTFKCGGRRKAQLGLDIREGGIAIPIANNMWYIHGRKHEDGGVTMGPNNKNGVEVEGGEVVEMIDSNHPSVGRQFAAGGQSQTMRVFSSVPLLRGASPAGLVLQGYNPDAVFKAQEEFKDRNRINDDGTTYEMGGEGKPKSKYSRPVKGVLPYGYAIRNLYAVENPYRKGIKGNIAKMYDNRTLGAGVDVVSGHPELYKKAKSGRITKKQADETAVIHLRKDDNAIRNNYADVYGKAAADTLSYGPRFLVAQARYQQGNVRKAWPAIHKAMAKGNVKALKKAVLQVTPKDHTYRRQWIEDFKVYKAGGIYIKPSKRGIFTAAATKHGMSVQGFASKVLANKEDYSSTMVKKANFARNASRWKKEFGGDENVLPEVVVTGKKPKTFFEKLDDYADISEKALAVPNLALSGASLISPNPITLGGAYLTSASGALLDLYQGGRALYKGDWFNVGKNAIDLGLSLVGLRALRNANKLNELDKSLDASGAVREYVRKSVGRGRGKRKATFTKEKNEAITQEAIGYSSIPASTAFSMLDTDKNRKEYGGSMIYTINGNVKNGLMSVRPKAQYGKQTIIRHNKEWEYDEKSGVYIPVKNVTKYKTIAGKTYKKEPDSKNYVEVTDSIEKIKVNQPKKQIVKQNKNSTNKLIPINENKYTSATKPNTGESYVINPLTGEWIRNGVTETSEPSVKGTTKVSAQASSTPRGRGTKASTSKAAAKTTTKGADVKYGTPLKEKKESLYITGIKNNSVTPLRAGMEKIKSHSSTGGGTQSKNGRWIGQYKTTNVGDWIGLGSNLAGSVASYFMTKNAINKMPEPIKPVMAQAAKLKTRYNIEPSLTEIREAEQMNRAAVRRNTQSSNTSLAREQRLMNEARGARNTLYGQKENIETQLINQDRLNRQSVYQKNVDTYNNYLNRIYLDKQHKAEARISNINNLIGGLTGSVNNMLNTIETRRTTNNTLRAIAAANPNVDARLIGGFDNYLGIGPDGKPIALYDKHQKLVRYI